MCVLDPIKLTISNWDSGTEMVEVENNPGDESAGTRMIPFSGELWIEREDFSINPDKKYNRLKPDGEVRLKGGYVVKANDYITDDRNNIIEVICTYDPLSKSGMSLDRKIKGTIHWVSIEHGVNVEVRDYDRLFDVSNPNELDDFTNSINKNSLSINEKSIIEPYINEYTGVNPIQMIRKGYYMIDSKSSNRIIFNKSVSLKESYK
jgi:glutaminyl-tRNA synthetase